MKKIVLVFCITFGIINWSSSVFSDNRDNIIRNPDWDNRLPEKGKLGKLTKDWLRTQRRRLGVGPNVPLKFETLSRYRDGKGQITYRFKPYVHGIPVAAKHIVVHINEATRDVLGMRGRLNLEGLADIQPRINRGDATARVVRHGLALTDIVGDAELVFLTKPNDVSILSWQVEVKHGVGLAADHDLMFFDAMTGDLKGRHALLHRSRDRHTFDSGNDLLGRYDSNNPIREEDSKDTQDICLDDAHNNAGIAYDYFKSEHSRDSYDDSGARINSVVRVMRMDRDGDYTVTNHAAWTGSLLIYGDGDSNHSCFPVLDVVAHEFTHAVTENSAGLVYEDESGALNESWSDAFGAAIEAHYRGVVNDNTWYAGEDILDGGAFRDMSDPTRDTASKDHYGDYTTELDDNGGVHTNSGIPNLAFYLLSAGGTHPRGKTYIPVSGISISKAASIWYDALTNYMDPDESMHQARASTLLAAFDRYDHAELSQVANAWAAVGVGDAAKPSNHACLPNNFVQYQSTMSDIFIAYYGRPADRSGMDFWNGKLVQFNGNLNAIMSGFADSAEFNARFGGLNNSELVINIYRQLFNRDPDAGGLNFYVNWLDTGTRTLESIALDILNGASGSDLTVLNNRREVAGDHYRYILSTGVSLSAPQLAKLLVPITFDHQTARTACADSLLLSEYTE